MAPLVALAIKMLLPVAVSEVQKKLAEEDPANYSEPKQVPIAVAAPIAAKAASVGLVKSKTSWFAVALLVLGFLEQNMQLLSQFVPADKMGVVVSGIGFLTLLLRTITTTSIVDKAEPKE